MFCCPQRFHCNAGGFLLPFSIIFPDPAFYLLCRFLFCQMPFYIGKFIKGSQKPFGGRLWIATFSFHSTKKTVFSSILLGLGTDFTGISFHSPFFFVIHKDSNGHSLHFGSPPGIHTRHRSRSVPDYSCWLHLLA